MSAQFSRREVLRLLTTAGPIATVVSRSAEGKQSPLNGRLLDECARRACRYFYEMADPSTGLVRDRASAREPYAASAASIAATGFGLSALAIGASRGYLDRGAAESRVRATLRFFCERAEQEHGFFYHFLESDTGKRIWKSEASSVDTAWLLCGVLHSQAYWNDGEIRTLAGIS